MIEKIRFCLNKVLAVVVSALLIVMTVLVLWQVFTRYVLNNPAVFTEELIIIILVWTSFVGAAYAFGRREHMALVFLRDKLNCFRSRRKNANPSLAAGTYLLFPYCCRCHSFDLSGS